MRGKAVEVVLSDEEREFLEAHVRRHKAPRSLSDRCRIILLCAEGLRSREVAERTGVHEHTVGKWRRRFAERRIEGLSDEYRSGPAPHRDGRQGGRGGGADGDHDAEGVSTVAKKGGISAVRRAFARIVPFPIVRLLLFPSSGFTSLVLGAWPWHRSDRSRPRHVLVTFFGREAVPWPGPSRALVQDQAWRVVPEVPSTATRWPWRGTADRPSPGVRAMRRWRKERDSARFQAAGGPDALV